MTVREARTMGKEQLILLPLDHQTYELPADSPGAQPVSFHTGRQAIVVSGYAGTLSLGNSTELEPICISPPASDDEIKQDEVHFLVGPFWGDIVQVSASVSLGSIISLDSDEVDHSRWVIDGCTWEIARFPPQGEKIRLRASVQWQGVMNCLFTFGYQVVATGVLDRLPKADEVSVDPADLIPIKEP